MATPSQPSNPSNQNPLSSRDLATSIKQLIEDQGDYNNLLKDALKEANKMDGVYKKIEARVRALNKDTINIKEVSRELYKLKQKEEISRLNLADVEKGLSKESQKDLERKLLLNEKLKIEKLNTLE